MGVRAPVFGVLVGPWGGRGGGDDAVGLPAAAPATAAEGRAAAPPAAGKRCIVRRVPH